MRDKDTRAAGAGAVLRRGVVSLSFDIAFDVMAEMSRNWLWNQKEAKPSNVHLPKDGCELS